MLNVKPIRQIPGYCGPTSLKMVLEYYGVRRSQQALAKLSGATRGRGAGAVGLARAAKQLGVRAVGEEFSTLNDIRGYVRRGVPAIVDWFSGDNGHYSVVVALDKRFIYLQDPELGRVRKLDRKVFLRVWFDFPGNVLRSRKDLIIRRMLVVHRNSRR